MDGWSMSADLLPRFCIRERRIEENMHVAYMHIFDDR